MRDSDPREGIVDLRRTELGMSVSELLGIVVRRRGEIESKISGVRRWA